MRYNRLCLLVTNAHLRLSHAIHAEDDISQLLLVIIAALRSSSISPTRPRWSEGIVGPSPKPRPPPLSVIIFNATYGTVGTKYHWKFPRRLPMANRGGQKHCVELPRRQFRWGRIWWGTGTHIRFSLWVTIADNKDSSCIWCSSRKDTEFWGVEEKNVDLSTDSNGFLSYSQGIIPTWPTRGDDMSQVTSYNSTWDMY